MRNPASRGLAAAARKVQDRLVRDWLMKLAAGERATLTTAQPAGNGQTRQLVRR
jgi:hypothetical protein